MERRSFVGALAGGLLAAAPGLARARPGVTVYRIGVLDAVPEAANAANLSAFREALGELGYVEGSNLIIDYRSADGRPERFRDLALELAARQPHAIVTRGDPAAMAARLATTTTPIVMASSTDPAAVGIVKRLERPGGNVTGLHGMTPVEVGGTRLQILKELVPRLTRVGVLWNPATHHTPLVVREINRTASALRVQVVSFELRGPENVRFERTLEEAILSGIDALVTVEDQLTIAYRARLVEFAAMGRLPAMYGLREFVEAGGLIAYGADRRHMFRRAAGYVDRILKGSRPADLAIEPPSRFELVVNARAAAALNLSVPPALLARADEVLR